jgi:ubiquinone/menaquinone biosynthesis C-methylase UbiE
MTMSDNKISATPTEKELAYIYDLYVVPTWREAFDRLLDEEIKLPEKGKFLDAGCGTGGSAIDLAVRGGHKTTVVGVDASEERLILARGKAEAQQMERASFQQGSLQVLPFDDEEFDLVIGDASMFSAAAIGAALAELMRVAKPGATVALKLTTRGSFDEFFSIYWEALYNLDLLECTPQLEALTTTRFFVSEAEDLAKAAGLKGVRSATRKEEFDYTDGQAFFEAPLIDNFFLNEWLAVLPNEALRQSVMQEAIKIIDQERQRADFDISIKATVIIGQK